MTKGGKREGAGRPAPYGTGKRRQVYIRPDVWDWLNRNGNVSQTIEKLAREKMNNYVSVILTDEDLAALDDGQEWWNEGDDVRLGWYKGSQMADLCVNGETHDNWIEVNHLPASIIARSM